MPASKPRRDNAEFRKYFCDFCAKTPVYTNHAIRYTQYERSSASYRQIKNRRTTGRITRAAHPLRPSAPTLLRPLCKGHICPLQTEPARSAGRNGNRKRNRKRNRNWNWNKEISLSAPDFPYRRFLHQTFPIDAFCTKFFVSTLSAQRISYQRFPHRIFATGQNCTEFSAPAYLHQVFDTGISAPKIRYRRKCYMLKLYETHKIIAISLCKIPTCKLFVLAI